MASGLSIAAAGCLAWASPASAAGWSPEPATFGVGETQNVSVPMADGTALRANVYFPTDPRTGAAAPGPFPVVMVQTPYGKSSTGSFSGQEGGAEAATQAGPLPYLVSRGYIDVVAEVRGTGDSQGTFNLLDPIQGQDGAALVRWASTLPHSSGRVGLYGPSYMGLDQFMTASALGPGSPLQAMFPIVAGNDTYRDVAFEGGIADGEFDLAVILTIFGPLEIVNPVAENPTDFADLIKVESQHAPGLLSYNAAQLVNVSTGGDQAYDETYWQLRAPRNMLTQVVRNHIPAFMIDGWFDLYQRGAPLNYSGLQNAYLGRSVAAPMRSDQPVTGRYQLLQGPWYHLTAGTGVDIYRLELAWFDRWLKDQPTGIDQASHPLHLYELGSGRWVDASRYPLNEAQPQTYYLAGGPSGSGAPSTNDEQLTTARPRAATGADPVAFVGQTSPCDRQSEQWSMGALTLALESGQLPGDPCTRDDRTLQAGPGALTYTTAAMAHDTVIAGPVAATIYATSTRPEVELVATLEDIAPDGASAPLTSGALLGSFRAVDAANSWLAPDGRPLLPFHPYTRASVTPVTPGAVTRYDIEINPILADLRPGHRLRLTLTTSDTPHLLPLAQQAANLAGGVYQVQRNSAAASYLELPVAGSELPGTSLARSVAGGERSGTAACASGRRFRIRIGPRHGRLRHAVVRVNGRRVRVIRGPRLTAVIDLRGLGRSTATVTVTGRTRRGRYRDTRRYRLCRSKTPVVGRPRHRPS
jgi:putative CocE/NonD family hydrolase